MANISIYTTNGVTRFENIFEQLANGRVESVTVNGDYAHDDEWELGVHVNDIDGEMHLVPFIGYKSGWGNANCQLRYYIGIKNTGKSIETKQMLIPEGRALGPTLKFLDLQPELLNDGALTIEYGFRVEAIQKEDGIWNYPMYTGWIDSKGEESMVLLSETGRTRCHRQIMKTHRVNSYGREYYGRGYSQYIALQVAHGVHFDYYPIEYYDIAIDAYVMTLRNVVHYCQWKLIQFENDINPPIQHIAQKFAIAVHCQMRSYLVHLIRDMASKKEMMKILKAMNTDEMPGESMKTFVKYLLFD